MNDEYQLDEYMIDQRGVPGPLHPLHKDFLKNIPKADYEWGLKEIEKEQLMERKPKVWPEQDNWPGSPEDAYA